MNDAVLRSTRHEVWANAKLLRFCAALPAEQLRWTAPGTYGTIHGTLQHIIRAQRGYLWRFTAEEDPATDRPLPRDDERLVPIDELLAHEERIGERMEALLSKPFDADRVIQLIDGTATAGILLAQFIHHGSDHRAHVGTILGANGVGTPWLDVWAYGYASGEGKYPAED